MPFKGHLNSAAVDLKYTYFPLQKKEEYRPVVWRFWRKFLNAAAKFTSFVQSQQLDRDDVSKLKTDQCKNRARLIFPLKDL